MLPDPAHDETFRSWRSAAEQLPAGTIADFVSRSSRRISAGVAERSSGVGPWVFSTTREGDVHAGSVIRQSLV
jgi:hypothetical protein